MAKSRITVFFASAVFFLLTMFSSSSSYSQSHNYNQESCDGMFRFVSAMVEESSKVFQEDEQKSLMYSQLAANYAQIYNVFCDKEEEIKP